MTPFDGLERRGEHRAVAAKKARARRGSKPTRLGANVEQVYQLCREVVDIANMIDTWRGRLEDANASGAPDPAAEIQGRMEAASKIFERWLVTDPWKAVGEWKRIWRYRVDARLVADRVEKLDEPVRAAAITEAVLAVEQLLRAGRSRTKPPPPLVQLRRVNWSKSQLKTVQDFERIMADENVQAELAGQNDSRGGPKKAAVAIVAIVSGWSTKTVSRAAGTSKALSRLRP